MDEVLANYAPEEFDRTRRLLVKRMLGDLHVTASENPQAVLLGGQSGAGKTMLHALFRRKFQQNIVVINGDEYRSHHPHYRELDAKYGPEAVSYTAAWAGKMTESLIDALSVMQYNLIIEGTLRTAKVPLDTASLLKSRGYGVSLALMAVKPEISLISCQIRYEQMRLAGTIPRATDPKHHNKIVHEIVNNLSELEKSGLFDEVKLYARSGECLYPRLDGAPAANSASVANDEFAASDALKEILFGSWSAEEQKHYAFLKSKLAELRGA